ncbi:unnamed protein product [Prunus brigantina]
MDEILLTGRSDEEAIDDSMAFSIQSDASVSNMADCLSAIANKIHELNIEDLSIRRMLHESHSYYINTHTFVMLQISNEKILEDQERLMAKLKRHCSLSPEASRS